MDIKQRIMSTEQRRKTSCSICGKNKIKYKHDKSGIFETNFCSKTCVADHCIKLHKLIKVEE